MGDSVTELKAKRRKEFFGRVAASLMLGMSFLSLLSFAFVGYMLLPKAEKIFSDIHFSFPHPYQRLGALFNWIDWYWYVVVPPILVAYIAVLAFVWKRNCWRGVFMGATVVSLFFLWFSGAAYLVLLTVLSASMAQRL
jgi:type II secretory pathway component PulF